MFHILVVDDDKNTRQLIKAVLETENYIVIGATDGEDALKVLDRSHIDLVILDPNDANCSNADMIPSTPEGKLFQSIYAPFDCVTVDTTGVKVILTQRCTNDPIMNIPRIEAP